MLQTPAPPVFPLQREASDAQDPANLSAPGLALSAVGLGCAVQINFGQYHPVALVWLTVALVGVALCVAKRVGAFMRVLERRRITVFAFALIVQFTLLLTRSPGATGRLAAGHGLLVFQLGVLLAAAVCAARMLLSDGWHLPLALALTGTYLALGAWVLKAAPDPGVDVCVFQRDASAALLRGDNPYAITFPDPYQESSAFYGPGVSVNGRLRFGYPYPPLSLLLVLPAHLLGDFRYAQLVAMALAGLLLALCHKSTAAFVAAALLLFTPRGFFVLEAGWTEPFAVLFLAACVFAALRAPRLFPVALGLLLASKQYLVLGLLVVPVLPPRWRSGRVLLAAAGVAVGVTLPLALWDLWAFMHSAVLLQFRQPFRDDALSYLVPLKQLLGHAPPAWLGFIAAAGGATLALCKAPRTVAGFAAALALVLLAFFAFNKQAFCNYFHLVIGALCCALAAPGEGPQDVRKTGSI